MVRQQHSARKARPTSKWPRSCRAVASSTSCEAVTVGTLSVGRWAVCGACMVRLEAWLVRPVGAICGTDVPAVRLDFDQSDQLLNTFTLMPCGRESIQVQQQQVKKLRCKRYIQPGNQQRESRLSHFPRRIELLRMHQPRGRRAKRAANFCLMLLKVGRAFPEISF